MASQQAVPQPALFQELKSHLLKLAVSCGCGRGVDLIVVCAGDGSYKFVKASYVNMQDFYEPA